MEYIVKLMDLKHRILNMLKARGSSGCYFWIFRLPNGPWGNPLFGAVFQLNPEHLTETLENWKDKYGDIFSFSLPGWKDVVVVC